MEKKWPKVREFLVEGKRGLSVKSAETIANKRRNQIEKHRCNFVQFIKNYKTSLR